MNMKSLKGTFLAVSDEALSLQVKDEEVAIQRPDVFRVMSRETNKRSRNALIGLCIGGAAGVAAGAAAGAGYHKSGETGLFMLVFTPIGAGVGAGIGAAIPSHPSIYRATK